MKGILTVAMAAGSIAFGSGVGHASSAACSYTGDSVCTRAELSMTQTENVPLHCWGLVQTDGSIQYYELSGPTELPVSRTRQTACSDDGSFSTTEREEMYIRAHD